MEGSRADLALAVKPAMIRAMSESPSRLPTFLALLAVFSLGVEHARAEESTSAGTEIEGVLAMRGDQVIVAANADRLFVPASVQKLVLATAALDALGPEFRIETRVFAGGPRKGSVLDGDLIVEAGGDPTWSEEFLAKEPRARLREIAQALVGLGVDRVQGDLVIDRQAFPGRDWPSSRPMADLGMGFSAPTSGLAIGENSVEVEIAPGLRVGTPGRLAGPADLELVNRMITVSAERHERGSVEFRPVWGSATVIVVGEYPISERPFRVSISVPDPDRRAGRALLEELRAAGIDVTGDVRMRTVPLDGDLQDREEAPAPLVSVASPPLGEILIPLLTDSSNWIAEMLLRVLAREVSGEGRIDLGLDEVERFLVETVGVVEGSFVLDDGSGLSQYNLITPRTVLEVLRFAWRQPWRSVLLQALSRPGTGTLRFWPELPPLVAKTGTLRDTVALAGIVEPGSESPLFFVWLVNHEVDGRPEARRRIASSLRSWHTSSR